MRRARAKSMTFTVPAELDEQVFRLGVAVDPTAGVHVGQGRRGLFENLRPVLQDEVRLPALDAQLEVASREELHDEEGDFFALGIGDRLVDLDDVGMGQFLADVGLVLEHLAGRLVLAFLPQENLHGEVPMAGHFVDLQHLAILSRGKGIDHAVAFNNFFVRHATSIPPGSLLVQEGHEFLDLAVEVDHEITQHVVRDAGRAILFGFQRRVILASRRRIERDPDELAAEVVPVNRLQRLLVEDGLELQNLTIKVVVKPNLEGPRLVIVDETDAVLEGLLLELQIQALKDVFDPLAGNIKEDLVAAGLDDLGNVRRRAAAEIGFKGQHVGLERLNESANRVLGNASGQVEVGLEGDELPSPGISIENGAIELGVRVPAIDVLERNLLEQSIHQEVLALEEVQTNRAPALREVVKEGALDGWRRQFLEFDAHPLEDLFHLVRGQRSVNLLLELSRRGPGRYDQGPGEE